MKPRKVVTLVLQIDEQAIRWMANEADKLGHQHKYVDSRRRDAWESLAEQMREQASSVGPCVAAAVNVGCSLIGEKIMHVFTDDEEFVVAADAADARRVMAERGVGIEPDVELEQLDDDYELTIAEDEEGTAKQRKTCGEWAAEKGRGWLCASTSA